MASAVLALGACSTPPEPIETSASEVGMLEVALSSTCDPDVGSECVAVNGENVLLPAFFDRVAVENVVAADGQGQNLLEVTFTDGGAVVFRELTMSAVAAGGDARLVIKAGDEILAATAVMESLQGDQVTIALSPQNNPSDVIRQIEKG